MSFITTADDVALVALLAVSLALLGGGWSVRSRRSHVVIMAGEVLFALYWLLSVPHFMEVEDYVNASFSALGVPFFAWTVYHHYLSYRWDEEVDSLRWVAGAVFITGTLYFGILYIDPLAKGIIWATAWLTVAVLGLFGYQASLGVWVFDSYEGHALVVQGDSTNDDWISIVLACTGMQAIALFIGAIAALRPDRSLWEKWAKGEAGDGDAKPSSSGKGKGADPDGGEGGWDAMGRRRRERLLAMTDRERFTRAYLYTVPVIIVGNLARNVAIVFLVYEGYIDFYTAHHVYAKTLAFMLLIVLTLACFSVLPELQENILGIMDLAHRKRKGDVENGFVRMDIIRAASGKYGDD